MAPIDLGPATRHLATLVRNVRDDQLDAPTPSTDRSVAELLDHIAGLSMAFTAAAQKDLGDKTNQAPAPDASQLEPGWRDDIPAALADLADAWRVDAAWTGMTQAGGLDLPAEIAGLVALDEVVLHGWDLAVATDQQFACDQASLEAVHGFVQQFSGEGHDEERQGLFGPEVAVPADGPLLTRVLGMAGRDASWRPPRPNG
jgi:uncharacterized protein (TIGR03086 family)